MDFLLKFVSARPMMTFNGLFLFSEIPIYHVLTAKVTFGNIHGTDRGVDGVSTFKENTTTFCAVDEDIFAIPAGYRRQGWLN